MMSLWGPKRLNQKVIENLDKCIDFGYSMFHSMISKEMNDWHYFGIRRDHDSMITEPKELSGLLLEIINGD